MALNSIQSNSTWGRAASDINTNFTTISTDLEKVKNATTKNKGYFKNDTLLKQTYKTATVGDIAYVGTTYPYQIWEWNGSGWVNSGATGGSESVNLNDYATKEEFDKSGEQEKVNIAKTKFFVSDDVDLTKSYAANFFGLIIQKVRVNWDKNSLPDTGQKWAITYIYVRSSEDKPYPEFDGRLTFTMLVDGKVRENAYINLYDYGYTRGYKGIIEINNVKPYSSYNITFSVTIDCEKLVEDIVYSFGNSEGSSYEGKVYILPQFYFDTTDLYAGKDSYYYEALANKGKDFPISYDEGLPYKPLTDSILDACIICENKYRVNIAYINRAETNSEKWDNTVGFRIFDESGEPVLDSTQYFYNDADIAVGKTGIVDKIYNIKDLSLVIKIRWLVDNIPHGVHIYGQNKGDTFYNKIPFSYFVYTPVPGNSKESFYYNVLVNAGKDFPVWIAPDVSRKSAAIKVLNDVLLYAEIITTDDIDKYTYELAYINKTETNAGQFDNSVQLNRRLRSNVENVDSQITINHIDGIMNGELFWLEYQWDNAFIRLYLDASKITYSPVFISNDSSQSVAKNGKQYIDKYCYKKIPNISNDLNVSSNTQIVKVIGENLYIGAKYDKDNDILITFSKCMFNNLMTFSKVGLAANINAYPLSNPERSISESLNITTSDNIGPISTSSGGWCGGNHSYLEQNKVKTAETISYEFYADGVKLNDGNIVQATSVEVKVKNRIYNPTIPPEEGADILSEELCIEDVAYKIKGGNIFVSLSHTYTNETPITIAKYYGMQSMCSFEDYIMTPNGRYVEFTEKATVAAFNKSEYPNFRRCIEKNADNNRYQSTYLLPYEAGKHEYINDEDRIFSYSSGKCYNVLVVDKQIKSGDIIEWAGLYTWFTALQDDENVLVYTGCINGRTYLFIDAKKAVSETYIQIPPILTGSKYEVIEKTESIITLGEVAGAKGLKFASNATGTLILSF